MHLLEEAGMVRERYIKNIKETKEFSINLVSESFVEQMIACSTDFDPDIDEFDISKLTPLSSKKIKPPIVKESKLVLNVFLIK